MSRARTLFAVLISLAVLAGFGIAPAAGAVPQVAGAALTATQLARPSGAAPRGPAVKGLFPSRRGGPCRGEGFEMWAAGKLQGCTHGPDPAPEGAAPRSDAELRALSTQAATASGNGIKCTGDGTSGKRVQAIYAFVNTDRSATIIPLIRMWAGHMSAIYNASAAETNGSRQIRWVHSNSTNCQLTVSKVQLPNSTINNFSATVNSLHNKGFNKAKRKYSVWMDVPMSSSGICGIGQIIADERAATNNKNNGVSTVPGMVARTDRDCWGLLSDDSDGGGFSVPAEMTEAHELGHTMGAVQAHAPHHTSLGHCTDEWDAMCYDDDNKPGTFPLTFSSTCLVSHSMVLDCGHNDYFHTNPTSGYLATHWDAAKNAFLVPNVTPGNDKFAGAMSLAVEPGTYAASNRLATEETGEPTTAGQPPSRSIWFTVRPTSNGVLTVDTDRSAIDTVLGVYTGSTVGGLTLVGQNDNGVAGKTYSRLTVPVTSGVTYRVKVDGKGGAQGPIMLYIGLGSSTPVITGFSPTSGPPGTQVTVSGTNLIVCPPGGGTCDPFLMSFDGIHVTTVDGVTVSPTTTITVRVPSGAKDGPITLNDDRGATIADTNFNVT